MPRKAHKFHYIYKTTCIITNCYYYGMHSTSNLEDGYLGSGKRLRYSIRKHGEENHKIEILEYLPSREKLKKREAEIVNEELIKDPLCMNLQLGGGGGFSNKEHQLKCNKGSSIWIRKQLENEEYKSRIVQTLRKNVIEGHKKGIYKYTKFKGKKHSKETIEKMKLSHQGLQNGEKNSQYGTCWITNEKESKKINKEDLIPEGWRLGRKVKWNKRKVNG